MKVPQHVSIIPDGNRRFAKQLMQKPWKGHEWGSDKIENVFEWSRELGIKVLTFYTLSLENLDSRPKKELNFLFRIAKRFMRDILNNPDSFIHKSRVRVRCFGQLDKLPQDIQEDIAALEAATKEYSDYYVNLAIAYGGRQELVEACQAIGQKIAAGTLSPHEIDETILRHNLSTNGHPDPDLIIRTGGEKRLSNFLLYQSAYSELEFLSTLWPELTKEEFTKVVRKFGKRERRFGK
ncbi:MAG: polyprenyl diphosphate synthase [Candidatus Aenigmatarchaeota archaeon]